MHDMRLALHVVTGVWCACVSARLPAVILASWFTVVHGGPGLTVRVLQPQTCGDCGRSALLWLLWSLCAAMLIVVALCCCAGASWSSVDYGGVCKPVHYGVARAFADVTLSVQHDLQDDTISVRPSCTVLCRSVLRCISQIPGTPSVLCMHQHAQLVLRTNI
jgi:hypothetical protein